MDWDASLRARLAAAPVLADPEAAAARLAELGDRPVLADPAVRALVLGVADHAPFLWQIVRRDPEGLERLLAAAPEAASAGLVADQRAAGRPEPGARVDPEAVARRLRRNRARHALLVALADIGGVWPLEAVTGSLSDFADASVTAALEAGLHQAAAEGRYRPPDPADPGAGCGLVVLGLGKLGARELNYSSDVDLVVFFDPRADVLRDGLAPGPFHARLAQGLARMLEERTGDGYVHRVDYRLRPDPGSTPVALSLDAAYGYYESLGQNWERAAFIKARPVAGDRAAGQAFLDGLTPFVWRKYFDFGSIADVHAMKRQIHAVRGHDALAVAGHDIKLGRGGIREVEFFVQTQQLVFGGRRPSLRGRATVPMLAALEREGWISPEARDELAAAYRFLRGIEHRLQMVRDEQTQRLPADPEALARFANFAGFADLPAFAAALTAHARRVQAHYALLFEAGEDLAVADGDLVFSGAEADPATLVTLARLGLRDPARAVETVRGWHFGRRPAVRSPRAREVLTELVPALMRALAGTPDPDAALAALDRAFERMPAAVELLVILRSHERLRLLFCDLLGTAPRLADAVAFSPHVLDAVIDPGFPEPTTEAAALAAQYRALVGSPAALEDFLDRSRDACRQLRFVAGARLLSGILAPVDAGRAFAGIAEAAVAESLAAVERAFAAAHGRVPGGRIAVVGFGRLGARQLTAESDLDLVVLYDFDPAARTSDGPRPLDAAVYANRLTQRLVAALTVPTRRGGLYEVDLRLRPGGGQGMIAARLASFRAYLAAEAELWELMALTRARVIAGDAGLGGEIDAAIREALCRPRDRAAVAGEVAAMRAAVAAAKGEGGAQVGERGEGGTPDLKLAPGGLMDLDFLAQALILTHASAYPDLVAAGAPDAVFATAAGHGLLHEDAAAQLAAAYRLLDDVHHWRRLTGEASPAAAARVARAVGLPDGASLTAALDAGRRAVRGLFETLLG